MYQRVPEDTWLQKGVKAVDQGLKIFGTAKGLFDMGRTAYQLAGPVLAMI